MGTLSRRARPIAAALWHAIDGLFFHALIPLALMVLVVGLIAWISLPRLVGIYAEKALSRSGVSNVTFDVRSIGLTRAELANLSMGGGTVTADHVYVYYYPNRLLDSDSGIAEALESVEIIGLRVRATIRDGKVDLGALLPSGASGGGEPMALALPPVPTLSLRDALITIDGDWGPMDLPVDAEITVSEDGVRGHFSLRPLSTATAGIVEVDVEWSPRTNRIDFYATIDQGWLRTGPALLADIACQVAGSVEATALGQTTHSPEATGFCRVGALDLPLGSVPADLEWSLADGRLETTLRVRGQRGAFATNLKATVTGLDTGAGDINVGLDTWIPRPEALSELSGGLIRLAGPPSHLRATATGRWNKDQWREATPMALLADMDLQGSIGLAVSLLTFGEAVTGLSLDGDFRYRLSEGHLAISGSGLSMAAASIAPGLFGVSQTNVLAPYIKSGVRLKARALGAPLALVSWDDGLRATVASAVSLAIGPPGEAIEMDASFTGVTVTQDAETRAVRIEAIEHATVTVVEPPDTPFDLRLSPISLSMQGKAGAFTGRVEIGAQGTLVLNPDLTIPDAEIGVTADFEYRDHHLSARLADGVLLKAGPVAITRPISVSLAPFAMRTSPKDMSGFDLWVEPDSSLTWRGSLSLAPFALTAQVDGRSDGKGDQSGAEGPMTIDVAVPAVTLLASGSSTGDGFQVEARGEGGEIKVSSDDWILPDVPLRLFADGLSFTVKTGAETAIEGTFGIARLGIDGPRPPIVPVSITAKGRATTTAIDFEAELTETSGNIVVRFEGSHDVASSSGSGELRLFPVHFIEDGFQPSRLVPYFADRLGLTVGTIELGGGVTWSRGGLASDVQLTVRDLTTRFDEIQLVGVNTVMTFDRLLPPSTPPGQLVAIQGFDLGLPLTDGLLSLRFDRQGIPLLENSTWQWAGGEVMTNTIRQREREDEVLVLEVEGIELSALFALFPDTVEIEATGRLHGRIPVVPRDGEFVITEGWLESDFDGGTIRYRPNQLAPGLLAGGAGVKLLLDALDDFTYTRMRVELSGRADNLTDVTFRIRGSNPKVYGGSEFELNLNINGRLEQIFRQNYEAYYTLPESVARKLATRPGSKGPK